MNVGQVFQSISAWRKLSAITIKPSLAYKILKYSKQVSEDAEFVIEQRKTLVSELNLVDGMAQDDPVIQEFSKRYQKILATESVLSKLDVSLDEVVDQVEKKGGTLSVSDLAVLEPFFSFGEEGPPNVISFRNEDGTPKLVLDSE